MARNVGCVRLLLARVVFVTWYRCLVVRQSADASIVSSSSSSSSGSPFRDNFSSFSTAARECNIYLQQFPRMLKGRSARSDSSSISSSSSSSAGSTCSRELLSSMGSNWKTNARSPSYRYHTPYRSRRKHLTIVYHTLHYYPATLRKVDCTSSNPAKKDFSPGQKTDYSSK